MDNFFTASINDNNVKIFGSAAEPYFRVSDVCNWTGITRYAAQTLLGDMAKTDTVMLNTNFYDTFFSKRATRFLFSRSRLIDAKQLWKDIESILNNMNGEKTERKLGSLESFNAYLDMVNAMSLDRDVENSTITKTMLEGMPSSEEIRCPVCNEPCDSFYENNEGDIVGCENCITHKESWDLNA